MTNDWSEGWGSAGWAQAQKTPRGRLEAELIDATRGNQAADQMDEVAHAVAGITATDARCLDVLDRRGGCHAGQLADGAGITTGAVTAVIDRLEGKGCVRRVPDPDDRRRILVEVTEKSARRRPALYFPLGSEGGPGWRSCSTPTWGC